MSEQRPEKATRQIQNFEFSDGARADLKELVEKTGWSMVAVLERAIRFSKNPRKYKTFGVHIPRE